MPEELYAQVLRYRLAVASRQLIVIPKASRIDHVERNYAALNLKLSAEELATLEAVFPAPTKPVSLEM